MKKLFILPLLVLSFNASAGSLVGSLFTKNVNIVGKPIKSSFKDQVCHLKINGGNSTCSGVRISTDYVLTAQHCARDTEGKKNEISLDCNDKSLSIEAVYESKSYLKITSTPEYKKLALNRQAITPTQFDFALIKIKNPGPFNPKFKLLKNFSEYQSLFLNSSATSLYNYAENTYCEFHGYGEDQARTLDKYNSTSINTTTRFEGLDYLMSAESIDIGGVIQSPLLPEKNYKDKNWLYSSVRPGDSGGPLFCKAKTGEMVLSGIASVLQFGECAEKFQEPTTRRLFKPAKINCHQNRWGMPSKEALESILGVQVTI